jgi:hypothetical protein
MMQHSLLTVKDIIATCLKYRFFRQQVSNKAIAADYFVVYLGSFLMKNAEHFNNSQQAQKACVALT